MTVTETNCIIDFSTISNIVMAIASVLNIIIVIYIFIKEQNREKQRDDLVKNNEWLNSLGLKTMTLDFVGKLDKFKDESLELRNNTINIKQYKIDGHN